MTGSSEPLVSIVTPCLNPGSRLAECLRSIEEQKYPNIEHIVVDGGSTDGTLDLLNRTRSVQWVSEPDEGQSAALNKGFRMAKGGILSWLNADDELKNDSVEVALRVLLDRQADFVYGIVEVVEGSNKRLWVPPADPKSHLMGMGKGGVIPQQGSLFRSSAIERIGGIDESFELAMDFDMWLRFIDSGLKGVFVSHILATFHIHPESKTGIKGLSAFFLEEARSLLKGGHHRPAGAALGRAAAHAALIGGRADPRQLLEEIRRLETIATQWDKKIPGGVLDAAARTEAALVELQGGLIGIRHLLSPNVWATKESRLRLFSALKKRATYQVPI